MCRIDIRAADIPANRKTDAATDSFPITFSDKVSHHESTLDISDNVPHPRTDALADTMAYFDAHHPNVFT